MKAGVFLLFFAIALSASNVNGEKYILTGGGGRAQSASYSDFAFMAPLVSGKSEGGIYRNYLGFVFQLESLKKNSVVRDNLEKVYVYPNPYKPGASGAYGEPYVGGAMYEGVVFNNLTRRCKIQIFDITAQLVFEYEKDDYDLYYLWNTRNSYGSKVASGVYIYYITDDNGGKKSGKFSIIR